jgi:hypothetical protein
MKTQKKIKLTAIALALLVAGILATFFYLVTTNIQ